MFVAGNGNLRAASAHARGKGAVLKTFDAGKDAAEAGKAILDCRERERTSKSSPEGTT